MSGGTDLEVHPDDLDRIVTVLDAAGSSLFGHAPDLEDAPDAGASSGEVARALIGLSSAVAGLAQQIGSIAGSTAAVGADFTGTDQKVSGGMRQHRQVLGP